MAARTEPKPGRRAALLPVSALVPALATLRAEAPASRDYVHEIKLDGYRILARVKPGSAELYTRNGRTFSDRAPSIVAALAEGARGAAVLDGEIVCFSERGVSDFSSLQSALHAGHAARLFYVVFDALYIDGRDLRTLDLLTRKAQLADWLTSFPKDGRVRYGGHIEGEGPTVFAGACDLGLEGIVSKRAAAPYRSGRVGDWLKIKCGARQELVVVGFTAPRGTRAALGALVLGYYENRKLRYAGRVGTGFDSTTLAELHARLVPLVQATTPVLDTLTRLERSGVTWVRPELVAEVSFSEFTADGRVRHAVFKGLRGDKRARDVVRERPAAAQTHSSHKGKPAKEGTGSAPVNELHGEGKNSPAKKRAKRRV